MVQHERIPLETLYEQASLCRGCELWQGRTNLVFGVGNPNADVLVVGEAPGAQEDLQGEPFVGRAGKLLNEMLGYAGLRREDIYIANVLKCRPPDNRNPQAPEIQACSYFLREQTRTINPRFIVTLGNFAMKFILKTDKGITKMRGQVHQAGRFLVFPVYHPAYVLRNGSQRSVLQADFEELGRLLKEAREAAPAEAAGTPGEAPQA